MCVNRARTTSKRKIKGFARTCARSCRDGGTNKAACIETTAKAYFQSLYGLEEKVLATLEQLRALVSSPMLLIQLSELGGYHDLLIKHIMLIGG